MGKINWVRVIICGIVAGLVWTVLTSLITAFFSKEFVAAVPGGRLTTPPHAMVAFLLVLNLLMGMWAMWLYAAIRPRYTPGIKAAAIAGFAWWFIAVRRLLEPGTGWSIRVPQSTKISNHRRFHLGILRLRFSARLARAHGDIAPCPCDCSRCRCVALSGVKATRAIQGLPAMLYMSTQPSPKRGPIEGYRTDSRPPLRMSRTLPELFIDTLIGAKFYKD